MDNSEDAHQLNYGNNEDDYDDSEDRRDSDGDIGMDDPIGPLSGHMTDHTLSLSPGVEDVELEAIKNRVREMEEEAEKLRQLTQEVDLQMNTPVPTSPTGTGSSTASVAAPPTPNMSVEEKMEVDARSVYCGNVDYQATAEELEQHFHGCGSINRVTILCNKHDGHPKGFAYIEFADRESVNTAMAMDDSLFRGRQIKVMPKRTNRPGLSRGGSGLSPRGGPRGGGFSRPFRGRGGFYRGGYSRFPRRGGYRGRGVFYSPY